MAEELRFDPDDGGDRWSLFVAGDCVLDRDGDDAPLVDSSVREQISSANLSVANLEAPVPTEAEPIPKVGPALTTDADTPGRLADAGFDAVTLANNHLMDYGSAGVQATRRACDDAGLETTGAGECRADALEPARFAVGGTDVAVVGICEREFGVATDAEPGTAWSGHRRAVDAVRTASADADTVIVLAHGGIEYVPLPSSNRRARLREFVEAGADFVVGHHPHVAQGWEVHEGVPIFYSLGNFAFDRQANGENTARGLALDVEFASGSVGRVTLVPTVLDGSVRLLDNDAYLDYLHRAADLFAAGRYEAYWQAVAVEAFYERYSNWLLTGVGENLTRARANPTDASAQRPLWNPERRQTELLTLLNIVRNESHSDTMATALAVLSGETADQRTDAVREAVESLLTWTRR